MPAFDLGRRVGRKIAATPHRRAVVLCVVDAADFDGSLPRAALSAIVPRGEHHHAYGACLTRLTLWCLGVRNTQPPYSNYCISLQAHRRLHRARARRASRSTWTAESAECLLQGQCDSIVCSRMFTGTWEAAQSAGPAWQPQYLDGGFRLVLVANKADLLPSQISRPRLEVPRRHLLPLLLTHRAAATTLVDGLKSGQIVACCTLVLACCDVCRCSRQQAEGKA